ncbi:BMC domain-containing protein [Salmonella enterica]|nr:BMC domain-containing protein [Salmonella enterica]
MSTAINSVEMSLSADEIRERVRAAGVVGAGGAGFPAHVKLQAQVEIFLVNAAECEPMLKVDQQLMWQQAARLVRGVQYAMTATGAREGVIALKESIVETWSVAACISAADRAVKGSNVTLVRVHMAFGIGGKCYMVVAGDVSDVNNAVTVASESAGEKGLLVYRSVIPRPHEAMWRQMVEG